ncbi:MAG: histidine kinase [Clostridia bacterium]|nr:histidine kinase [Clostridia bacterium]
MKNLKLISILMLIPLCLISFFLYKNATSVVINEALNSNEAALGRTRVICDNLFKQMAYLSASAVLDNDVKMYMISDMDSEDQITRDNQIQKVNKFINRHTLVYEYIHSIYVYKNSSGFVVSNHGNYGENYFSDMDWISDYRYVDSDKLSVKSRVVNNVYPYLISFIRPTFYGFDSSCGAVVINVDLRKMQQLLKISEKPNEQTCYVVDKDGMILYSDDDEMACKNVSQDGLIKQLSDKPAGFSGQVDVDGVSYLVCVLSSATEFEYKYISIMQRSNYKNRFGSMLTGIMIIILFAFIIEFALSLVISAKIYQPFGSFIELLKSDEANKPSHEEYDELQLIRRSIMNTISSKEHAEVELAERLEMLNDMHINALQAQINPHFLFNTLETINWMAEGLTNSSNEVTRSILSLSKLIHMYSESDFYMVTLSQEIEYVMLYIDILKTRYDDMFEIKWDIDEELLNKVVVKFCLQPIIENAVQHGLRPKDEKGTIEITGRREKDGMIIHVKDDGVGMTDEQIDRINTSMNEKYTLYQKHIGMHNVNQRIKLVFGNEYGVRISHNTPNGICVSVYMQCIE